MRAVNARIVVNEKKKYSLNLYDVHCIIDGTKNRGQLREGNFATAATEMAMVVVDSRMRRCSLWHTARYRHSILLMCICIRHTVGYTYIYIMKLVCVCPGVCVCLYTHT